MNNFDYVDNLSLYDRITANTELQDGNKFFFKGNDCLDKMFGKSSSEKDLIKSELKGIGSIAAIAQVRKSLSGNRKYCIIVKNNENFFVFLFTVNNGLYNKMGPFKSLDSAISRADCFGLFENKNHKKGKSMLEDIKDYEDFYDDFDDEIINDDFIEDEDNYDDDFDSISDYEDDLMFDDLFDSDEFDEEEYDYE